MGVLGVSQLFFLSWGAGGLDPSTNVFIFPGFLVKKIKACRTKGEL